MKTLIPITLILLTFLAPRISIAECLTDACLYEWLHANWPSLDDSDRRQSCDLTVPDYTGFNYSTECVEFRKGDNHD